jgi:hypothetical protein
MDEAFAVVIGALVGAIAVFAGQLVAARTALRVEERKAELAREDTRSKAEQEAHATWARELKAVVTEVSLLLYSFVHSEGWVGWHGKNDPKAVNRELLGQYQNEVHESFPRLLNTLMVIGSMHEPTHDVLEPLAKAVLSLDVKIGKATVSSVDSLQAISEALGCVPIVLWIGWPRDRSGHRPPR